MISVLAVPKSIASSCVNRLKSFTCYVVLLQIQAFEEDFFAGLRAQNNEKNRECPGWQHEDAFAMKGFCHVSRSFLRYNRLGKWDSPKSQDYPPKPIGEK
jgi:hypothetical protein